MGQIFHSSKNTVARLTLFGAVLIVGLLAWAGGEIYRSPYVTRQHTAIEQPVPFSHKHHVSDDGIDCRYCHTSVEESSFAGVPATKICMNCHDVLWKDAPMLAPVRESYRTGEAIRWNRVNYVPQFVYFDHHIHVNKGIGCTTCHGPVGEMPIMYQETTMHMRWCLGCHEQPEEFVRPRDQVFNADYQVPGNQLQLGRRLVKEYDIKMLIDCWTCHR
jgi:hypothetical protein